MRQSWGGRAEWEIWYQDLFDRESPRRVELVGRGIGAGLVELWARYLSETVQAQGNRGFSRFNLWWKEEGKSIEVTGEWAGLVRLRKWVFGEQSRGRAYAAGGRELLEKVALAHRNLVLEGETSARIVGAAKTARDREEFEEYLNRILTQCS